ncbi:MULTISPECIES: choice-of-anchor D domain-containing protein [unclassified Nocardioides]|uniref:choice-of-anchor D domain-containing protein n=1 Tax=unclassified Nocardioides TaxID=2615069 RepID=UPI0006F34A4A|nr:MULTISPECIES: choice-of-anchor D domain-containing protein [unclassified Nocardioides]KRA37809.1 hypothetical protein ASD81_03700 [Nocardioides sp. Root614]KRA91769.1 hypothetical protein ASD84_03965 [Nocardioides sp. Root682]
MRFRLLSLVSLVSLIGLMLAAMALPASAAAAHTITPTPMSFPNATVNSTITKAAVIKNSGTTNLQFKATISGSGFALTNVTPGAGSCLTGPNSGLNVAPGGTCTVTVAFTPTALGPFSGTITVSALPATGSPNTWSTYSTTGTPLVHSFGVSGSGAKITSTVSPASLAFGYIESGAAKYLTAKVTNTATVPITVSPSYSGAVEFGPSPYFSLGSDACVHPSGETLVYQVVPVGGSCDLEVAFRPTATGSRTGTATLSMARVQSGRTGEIGDPGPAEVTKTVALSGSGTTPLFTLTPTSLAFGQITQGGYKTLDVTVKNTSKNPLQFWPDSAGSGYFSLYGDSCVQTIPNGLGQTYPITIEPAGTCRMQVTFFPETVGAHKATLVVGAYTPASPTVNGGPAGIRVSSRSLPVTGTGIAPTSTLAPTSLAFGTVTVEGMKFLPVKVTNTSTTFVSYEPRMASAGSAFFVSPGGSSSGVPDCEESQPYGQSHPRSIPAGTSCTFLVGFFPQALGSQSAQVIVDTHGNSGSVQASKTLAVSGTGGVVTLTASPTSIAFGNVTVTGTKTVPVVLTNTSNVSVQYWPGTATAPYSLSMGTCFAAGDFPTPVYVPPGGSCTAQVSFKPTATGAKSGSVVVDVYRSGNYAGPTGTKRATRSIAVSGTGIKPTMTVSPISYAFGALTVDTSRSRSVTVTNTSQIPLQFDISVTGVPNYSVTDSDGDGGDDNGCAAPGPPTYYRIRTIAPGEACTMSVRFHPTAVGSFNGTVTVTGHTPGEGLFVEGPALTSASMSVSGSGKALGATVSPTSLSFGYVKAGTEKVLTLTVTNTATTAVSYVPTGPSESPFQVVGVTLNGTDCAYSSSYGNTYLTVAPGGKCTITTRFAPWGVGARTGTFRIGIYRSPDAAGTYRDLPAGSPETTLVVNASGTGN